MKIKRFEVGPFAENTYLLTNGGEALLVDPGFSSEREFKTFRSKLVNSGCSLRAILLTHAHIDHVLGLPAALKAFDVDVYLNHTDLTPWNSIAQQAKMFGLQAQNLDFTPLELPGKGSFSLGQFSIELLFTPGHAPDHVSLYFGNTGIVIAGDTLFRQSVGRTDLYKGDSDLLKKSIKEKLYTLPGDTLVYPGHGAETTIAHEKTNNPFVKG